MPWVLGIVLGTDFVDKKKGLENLSQALISLVAGAGFEPATFGL
jgi:hypothetical protein